MYLAIFSFLMLFLLPLSISSAEEKVPLVTYHNAPPFIVDEKAEIGLTYDLARWLTARADGIYHFVVETMPRKRLDAMLGKPRAVVVPWVNPKWFEKVWISNQYWSQPYLNDSNAILSQSGKPFEYSGPKSVVGKTIAGLHGGRWIGLDGLVEQGKINRLDAQSYLQAIKMVLAGRADLAMVPDPVAKFYVTHGNLAGYLHFSIRPHSRYARHFLVTEKKDLYQFMEKQIPIMGSDPYWIATVTKHGLDVRFLTSSH